MSRCVEGDAFKAYLIDPPFSLFQFAEDTLEPSSPIRRLLTIGRQRKAKSMVIEPIPAVGSIQAENKAILKSFPDYENPELIRLSFWTKTITKTEDINHCSSEDCVGYALIKKDVIPSSEFSRWHIFEAIVRKYPYLHNYGRIMRPLSFRVGPCEFTISGCLYAQQNGLNKACAQVALRSLIATRLGDPEVSCDQINLYAAELAEFNPAKGLHTGQINHVLDRYAIPHVAIDYDASPDLRSDFPYQKLIYSGIESGAGALLAFRMTGPQAPDCGHIIPCFGHTFNEDAWGPQAESAYFKIGESIRYIPSRAWCSSFIVHDDNFGANLCIPVSLLRPEQVQYAVELLPEQFAFSGAEAEVASADYFYSLLPELPEDVIESNAWVKRLIEYVIAQKLILRSVAVSRDDYIRFLASAQDWNNGCESEDIVKVLSKFLPACLWMVEVTIPEIFSTNKHKLGEILLNATAPLNQEIDGESFLLARFPECFVLLDSINDSGRPKFITAQSGLKSHTRLYEAG